MDLLQALMIFGGITIPIGVYYWRESRYSNPAVRWKELAPALELRFDPSPPRLSGSWKSRELGIFAQGDGSAVLSIPLNCVHPVRLEIGPRADVEKDAGMVVPDLVRFSPSGDSPFERRFMVRATPPELGESATDAAMRGRLLAMKDVRVLAVSDRLDMVFPVPSEARELREWMDLAASLAEAVDGT